MNRVSLVWVIALAGCPHRDNNKPPPHDDARATAGDATTTVVLPPPPDVPVEPLGLPSDGVNPLMAKHIALGELLFHDPRLSMTGKIACATCHDPAHDFSGAGRQPTAAGLVNLRRAPALSNIKFRKEVGWDGRYASIKDLLPPHVRGQMGDDFAAAFARVSNLPVYRAHLDRLAELDRNPEAEVALAAIEIYVRTRYQGDSPWDRTEREHDVPAELKAGFTLFTGKAQCSVCHPPPLYTDLGYHRLGLIATKDDGRARVSADQAGAFVTPSLRGATTRTTFFHDGSAATLDAAIDWHLAGGTGQGADASIIDPALKPVKLSPAERDQLGAFVRALTKR